MLQIGTRKPEEVQFDQWDGSQEHAEELIEQLAAQGVEGKFIAGFDQLIGNLHVPVTPFLSFNGYNLRPGDYLVRRGNGAWEPMSMPKFLSNYDPQ